MKWMRALFRSSLPHILIILLFYAFTYFIISFIKIKRNGTKNEVKARFNLMKDAPVLVSITFHSFHLFPVLRFSLIKFTRLSLFPCNLIKWNEMKQGIGGTVERETSTGFFILILFPFLFYSVIM